MERRWTEEKEIRRKEIGRRLAEEEERKQEALGQRGHTERLMETMMLAMIGKESQNFQSFLQANKRRL